MDNRALRGNKKVRVFMCDYCKMVKMQACNEIIKRGLMIIQTAVLPLIANSEKT